MKHGSLFSGIGGFDLAAEWMGWENLFHCEWNEFGQKVLKYYWPKAISYNDITTTDFTIHRGNIDILTGGFPCQPYSQAGKRLGKADERHLWPHMLRAIREIQPTYVVAENVRGLVNWNDGMVFNEVQADMEAEGYEVTPFLLPAASVNAPHNRMRVWFVAYSNRISRGCVPRQQPEQPSKAHSKYCDIGSDGFTTDTKRKGLEGHNEWDRCAVNRGDKRLQFRAEGKQTPTHPNRNGRNGSDSEYEINAREGGEYALNDVEPIISHPEQQGLEGAIRTQGAEGFEQGCEVITPNPDSRRFTGEEYRQAESGRFAETSLPGDWTNFPTQPPICGGDDGIPRQLDGITFPKWRNETIKAYGNAIVPQVALQIFKAIQQTHGQIHPTR